MKKIFTGIIALLAACSLPAQNDSLSFVNGNWTVTAVGDGLVLKQCQFKDGLFNSAQTISILEVTGRKLDLVEAPDRTLQKTTKMAGETGAAAAINCGFFRMKSPYGSVMYYRQDYDVKYTNLDDGKGNFRSTRQTGSVVITDGKLYIVKADCLAGWEKYIAGEDVITSGPLMIADGKNEDIENTGFNTARHPRTAIGKKPDGTVIMIVVDGRHKGNAAGMSIFELQKVMNWLGCESAINLDGGGSSTMVVSGDIVNYPCDNRLFDHSGERKVHNAIIVH